MELGSRPEELTEPTRSDDGGDNPWSADGCIAYIDLTKVAGNGYCPECHNLSLYDHGPGRENIRLNDYEYNMYAGEASRDYGRVCRDIAGRGSTASLFFRDRSCQYCRMLRECISRLTACLDDSYRAPVVTFNLNVAANQFVRVGVSTAISGYFSINPRNREHIRDEGEMRSSLITTASEVTAQQPRGSFLHVGQVCAGLPLLCADATMAWLRQCRVRCKTFHKECEDTAGNYLPTRLLYLASSYEDMRLVETKDLPTRDKAYIALSHCWGRGQPLRLTTQNIDQLKVKVPLSGLTRVFRDAISVARYFEVEYLWIDALNILQDDPLDWAVEASQMASVFKHADFVVAATRSSDGSVAFLGPLATYDRDFIRFLVNGHDGQPVYVDAERGQEILTVPRGPTSDRAWCLQETILSRRAMHFTDNGAIWQCARECVSERFPLNSQLASLQPHQGSDLLMEWKYLIYEYSGRKLSRAQDRLPAISGLARRYHDVWKTQIQHRAPTYLAGLWIDAHQDTLQLSWQRPTSDRHSHSSSAEYVGPTWSWVSSSSSCGWPPTIAKAVVKPFGEPIAETATEDFETLCPEARIVDYNCPPRTVNSYGEVEPDSHIVLRGRAVIATIDAEHGQYCLSRLGVHVLSNRPLVNADCALAVHKVETGGKAGRAQPEVTRGRDCVETGESWSASVWIVRLWSKPFTDENLSLILGRPQQSLVEDSFVRLGTVFVEGRGEWWSVWQGYIEEREFVIV